MRDKHTMCSGSSDCSSNSAVSTIGFCRSCGAWATGIAIVAACADAMKPCSNCDDADSEFDRFGTTVCCARASDAFVGCMYEGRSGVSNAIRATDNILTELLRRLSGGDLLREDIFRQIERASVKSRRVDVALGVAYIIWQGGR